MQESDAVKYSRIVHAFFELFESCKRPPTLAELYEKTGMTHDEFHRLGRRLTHEGEALLGRLLTGSVVGGLTRKAALGDVKAVELFFKYVWGKTGADKPEPAPTLQFPDGSAV